MISELTDYDKDILRDLNGEKRDNVMWGAAMSVCVGFLQGKGLLTRGTNIQLTDKGREVAESLRGT